MSDIPNPDEQTPEAVSPESTAADPDSNDASNTSSAESGGGKKILIGSQRDQANPMLKTRESSGIRFASLTPEKAKTVIREVKSPETIAETEPIDKPAAGETPPQPETTGTPPLPVAPDAPVQQAIEDEAVPVSVVEFQAPTVTESTSTPSTDSTLPVADPVVDELEAALDELSMDSLMVGNEPAEELEVDSRVKATVSKIHNDNVFFALKGRFEGVASLRQFKKPPSEGTMLDVVVTAYNEEDGLYDVSIPGASISVADWSDLSEGASVEVRISGSNTGGLECVINNIRGFIPASQIDVVRVENLNEYINKKLQCVVMEVDPRRKKLVLSHRAILEREQQEKKKQLLETLAVGDTVDGVVTKLMDFGAFVDIGGVEGLVHVSKMSWDRVQHPKEVLEAAQKVSVKIEKIDPVTGKIGLSYRDTLENPWNKIDQKYPVGAVVPGTVSRLAQFGAFVKLEPGVEGLVHISELAHHRVVAVKNVVNQGDEVQVKVLTVDPSAQKIGLSLKETIPKPESKTGDRKPEDEIPEDLRPAAVKKRDEPLKGGRDRPSGGEQFGLNW